jgi:type IV fimbrial biogenesis protein FimT
MIKHQKIGYTLVEFCFALAIWAILLMLAIPSFENFIQQEKSQTTVYQLVNLLNYAKLTAIKSHTAISICASTDHQVCNSDWQGDFIVFIDKDTNGRVSAKKDILRVRQMLPERGSIRWQAKQTYLTMQPTGINIGNAGKFYYCPANNNLQYARAIIINLVGRIRIADQQAEPTLSCR